MELVPAALRIHTEETERSPSGGVGQGTEKTRIAPANVSARRPPWSGRRSARDTTAQNRPVVSPRLANSAEVRLTFEVFRRGPVDPCPLPRKWSPGTADRTASEEAPDRSSQMIIIGSLSPPASVVLPTPLIQPVAGNSSSHPSSTDIFTQHSEEN